MVGWCALMYEWWFVNVVEYWVGVEWLTVCVVEFGVMCWVIDGWIDVLMCVECSHKWVYTWGWDMWVSDWLVIACDMYEWLVGWFIDNYWMVECMCEWLLVFEWRLMNECVIEWLIDLHVRSWLYELLCGMVLVVWLTDCMIEWSIFEWFVDWLNDRCVNGDGVGDICILINWLCD